jgi:dTDP-4-dehydrorhamnose 3,5-epimerase
VLVSPPIRFDPNASSFLLSQTAEQNAKIAAIDRQVAQKRAERATIEASMRFSPLNIPGPLVIELEKLEDDRGFFARSFCSDLFMKRDLCTHYPQWSISFNHHRDTVRGLHFQAAPYEEIKLVRCTRGAIFDVVVDLRSGSSTRAKWVAIELTADNRASLYIPAGFAHGFQTLTDDAEVVYHISEPYRPEAARGVRWDDPDLAIVWPKATQRVISERDRALPRLRDL